MGWHTRWRTMAGDHRKRSLFSIVMACCRGSRKHIEDNRDQAGCAGAASHSLNASESFRI